MVKMVVKWRRVNYGDGERGPLDRGKWMEEIERRRPKVMAEAE